MGPPSCRTVAQFNVMGGTSVSGVELRHSMQASRVCPSISCSSRRILPMLINASAPLNLHRHVFKRRVIRDASLTE